MQITSDVSVAEVARLLPASIDVFERASIDYCCRGAHSLQEASEDAGLIPDAVIGEILSLPRHGGATETLTAIVRTLIEDHERCINEDIPQLRAAIEKAIKAHGATSPQLQRIARIYTRFASVTAGHMLNEERDLLPHVMSLESAHNGDAPAPTLRISHRVLGELVEHERIHEQLRTMRELAANAAPDCCTLELRAALDGFSRKVHYHMHVENNVLYPRAIEIENQLRRLQPA